MNTDALASIDKQIDDLIHEKKEYDFNDLKHKVEIILKSVDIFLIENELDQKAIDLYLKNVITQRNQIQKQKEQAKIEPVKQVDKYALIEAICQKLEFESKEALIKKLEVFEKQSVLELQETLKSL